MGVHNPFPCSSMQYSLFLQAPRRRFRIRDEAQSAHRLWKHLWLRPVWPPQRASFDPPCRWRAFQLFSYPERMDADYLGPWRAKTAVAEGVATCIVNHNASPIFASVPSDQKGRLLLPSASPGKCQAGRPASMLHLRPFRQKSTASTPSQGSRRTPVQISF
jgi:hypothetical protein